MGVTPELTTGVTEGVSKTIPFSASILARERVIGPVYGTGSPGEGIRGILEEYTGVGISLICSFTRSQFYILLNLCGCLCGCLCGVPVWVPVRGWIKKTQGSPEKDHVAGLFSVQFTRLLCGVFFFYGVNSRRVVREFSSLPPHPGDWREQQSLAGQQGQERTAELLLRRGQRRAESPPS
jgi:hypothetical protein